MKTIITQYLKILKLFLLLFFTSSVFSCKRLVEVPAPKFSINGENVYEDESSAIAAVTSCYASLSNWGGVSFVSWRGSLMADELKNYFLSELSDNEVPFYTNDVKPNGSLIWDTPYLQIFIANAAIEGLNKSQSLSARVKKQLLGEAHFIRAFNYFYLINLYGGVPIATTTDPGKNRLLFRSSVGDVYKLVVGDLKDAEALLSADFLEANLVNVSNEKVRPTKWAAMAMLARVYLYLTDYVNAEKYANLIIESNKFSLSTLENTFVKNSTEAIWNLQPTDRGDSEFGFFANTSQAKRFNISATGPSKINPVTISDELIDAFDAGDARKSTWVGSINVSGNTYFFPYKYKAGYGVNEVKEYDVVLRLAEQFLIRAEARARQGNKAGAIEDLNIIRNRASEKDPVSGANLLPAVSSSMTDIELYKTIEHERQMELFTEWGHRWFDLIRTPGFTDPSKTRADELMPGIIARKNSTSTWRPYKKLLPLPATELSLNPNLRNAQNPGYQ